MAYVGRGIDNISNASILDDITFTNSAGPYNLTQNSGATAFTPISPQALVISVDGVIQDPAGWTVSGSTITFGVSMASTLTNDFIVHNGVGLITEPSDGSVTTAKIENLAVTAAKLATDAVETAKIKDLNVTVGKLPASVDLSTKTITLPASVSGLGTGITNAQLAGSIDVTTKITGVVPTANLGSGSASASTYLAGDQTYKTISEYNDDALQNDIATLALHQATNANAAKYNLTNTNVDVFQDSTGVASFTDCTRNTTGEYVSTISSAVSEFTNDSDTQLLLHYDGSDASTTFTDSSSNGSTFSAGGNAQLDTAYKELGTASLLLDGTGDYSQSGDSIFDAGYGTDPFTIEFWYRPNATSVQCFISKGGQGEVSASYEGWTVGYGKYGAGMVHFNHENSGVSLDVEVYTGNLSLVTGTWYHFAIAKDSSNNYFIYKDGVSQALTGTNPDASSITTNSGRDLSIGQTSDNAARVNGHIDELRISTVCRYPSGTTFTPNEVTTASATGNFVSTATVANASVSKVGIVLTYKNAYGTNALNTDVIAEVSADGGANYSTATLVAGGTFSTGVLQAVANDISVTAGTSIQYRISFANQALTSKEAQINGVSLIY